MKRTRSGFLAAVFSAGTLMRETVEGRVVGAAGTAIVSPARAVIETRLNNTRPQTKRAFRDRSIFSFLDHGVERYHTDRQTGVTHL